MNKKIFLILIVLFVYHFELRPQDVLDKIVAVVDNEIILKSELDFQTQLLAYQRKLNANDPAVKKQVLNIMIEDKLVLAQAEIDSIMATDDEITRQLDYQIEMFVQQYGSKERLEQTYGMSIEKIKKELRDDIKKKILVQKTQELHLGKIDATRQEVEEFFSIYKDSLGKVPEEFKISQIFIATKLSESSKINTKMMAQKILDSILAGGNFSEFAKKYSEHEETAKDGGDLGFVKRGQFFKEFEEAVFTLKEGQVSEVVETPVGFHIIQLVERRGETVRAKHILLKIKKGTESDSLVVKQLNDIRDSVLTGKGKFADYAILYSEDKMSAEYGGDLGWMTAEELQPNMKQLVSSMKEGEISKPTKLVISPTKSGYQLLYLEKRVAEHKYNLEQDFEKLKQYTLMKKRQEKYTTWIKELKEKVYWETRLEGIL